jgi:hypothetical protein
MQRSQWRIADNWLKTQGTRSIYVDEARELLGRVPWGMTIWAINKSTSSIGLLAELLSTKWLQERHINTYRAYLASCAEAHVAEWWIGEVYFSSLIAGLPEELPPGPIVSSSSSLADYQMQITTGGYKHLLFPANVDNNR